VKVNLEAETTNTADNILLLLAHGRVWENDFFKYAYKNRGHLQELKERIGSKSWFIFFVKSDWQNFYL